MLRPYNFVLAARGEPFGCAQDRLRRTMSFVVNSSSHESRNNQ